MKKTILVLISTILMSVAFYSCSPSDKDVQKQVTTLLSTYTDATAEVKDGILTLSGKVESDEAKTKVQELLTSVKGVKSVVNNLTVQPAVVINPDAEINTIISTALSAGGFKSVIASVKDGEVTLTGDLKKKDLVKVMQLVNASSPKKVINQINLK